MNELINFLIGLIIVMAIAVYFAVRYLPYAVKAYMEYIDKIFEGKK